MLLTTFSPHHSGLVEVVLLCEGLLQAERAVMWKRMTVVVFNQSGQSGKGHITFQKDDVVLFKQSIVSGFAYADIPHHQHLGGFGSRVPDAIQSILWGVKSFSEYLLYHAGFSRVEENGVWQLHILVVVIRFISSTTSVSFPGDLWHCLVS